MIWLYRFVLGLPAREIDKQEILANFPELLENPEKLNEEFFIKHFILHRHNKSPDDFKNWISELKREKTFVNCPLSNCPYKTAKSNQSIKDDQSIHQFMRIGGDTKEPKGSFFDLVRTVHGQPNIKRVILTDPYILVDTNEDRKTGGLENLEEYLKTLGLTETSDFRLEITPSPKMYSENLCKNFVRYLKSRFPKIKIGRFNSNFKFHDRFYLVENFSGNLKGVFGPSLNGLTSKSIVLYGELEVKGAMDKMGKWFN